MPDANNNNSYTAPILSCDDPKEVVPDDYQVFLHKGYSLDQHKAFVCKSTDVDFDSAIERIFNETASHGLIYYAILDEDALAAVRSDIGVDLVICVVRLHTT